MKWGPCKQLNFQRASTISPWFHQKWGIREEKKVHLSQDTSWTWLFYSKRIFKSWIPEIIFFLISDLLLPVPAPPQLWPTPPALLLLLIFLGIPGIGLCSATHQRCSSIPSLLSPPLSIFPVSAAFERGICWPRIAGPKAIKICRICMR